MKKWLLTFSALTIVYSNSAFGELPACNSTPLNTTNWCTSHGYTNNINKCKDFDNDAKIKCPFDDSYVYCPTAETKECEVGDILYEDNNCYTKLYAGSKPKAVVFDAVNKLAIDLIASTQGAFLKTNSTNLYDGLLTYSSETKKYSGVDITSAMVGYCGSGATTETVAEEVVVPNQFPLRGYHKEIQNVTKQITGCKVSGSDYIADDPDNNYVESSFSGYTTSATNPRGWRATVNLATRIHGQSAATSSKKIFATPAKYCFDKSQLDCCLFNQCAAHNNNNSNVISMLGCPGAYDCNTINIKPWFLPAIGDLVTLKNNIAAVNSGLTAINNNKAIWWNDRGVSYGNSAEILSGLLNAIYNVMFNASITINPAQLVGDDALISSTLGYYDTGSGLCACITSPCNCPAPRRHYIYNWWAGFFNSGFRIGDNSFDNTKDLKTRCIYHYGNNITVTTGVCQEMSVDPELPGGGL